MVHTREQCKNCGREIGRLEKTHMYRDHVLCTECNIRLRKQDDLEKSNIQSSNDNTHFLNSGLSETKQRWNGFCIASFVLSLLLIPGPSSGYSEEILPLVWGLSIIIFVLSITFACIGLSQIGNNLSIRGKGFGIAAIIISTASVFIGVLF